MITLLFYIAQEVMGDSQRQALLDPPDRNPLEEAMVRTDLETTTTTTTTTTRDCLPDIEGPNKKET